MTPYFDLILACLLTIVGYFVKDLHSSFKQHKISSDQQHLVFSEKVGQLKGTIEMVKLKSETDISRIEQLNQLKLDQISKDVAELSKFLHQYIKSKP